MTQQGYWNGRRWIDRPVNRGINYNASFVHKTVETISKMFRADDDKKPSVKMIDKVENYKIRISKLAIQKMYLYVKIGQKEVGWMGTLFDEREDKNEFFLKDVYLATQNVSAVTTHLTPDGVGDLMTELVTHPDAMDICNNLKFWGHSHVNMGISPSRQDEDTVEELRGEESGYFLRGIFNKQGKIGFSLFLYDENAMIDDPEWYVEDDIPAELEEEIRAEFKEKVSDTPPPSRWNQHQRQPQFPNPALYGYEDFDEAYDTAYEHIWINGVLTKVRAKGNGYEPITEEEIGIKEETTDEERPSELEVDDEGILIGGNTIDDFSDEELVDIAETSQELIDWMSAKYPDGMDEATLMLFNDAIQNLDADLA